MKKGKMFGITFLVILILVAAGLAFFKFGFVFGEGVKAGTLNRVVYKGYVWKTYEGIIIQEGISSKANTALTGKSGNGTTIQSNEFSFSVDDKQIADSLMYHCGGKKVQLHYKEYKGALPWRGKEKFIVDGIVSVENPEE